MYLDVKGNCFKEDQSEYLNNWEEEDQRPLLFVFPGLTGTSNSPYVENIVAEAYYKRDFDVVAVNYRGLNGC